jgi:crossover junction endodeoxyribonuclease RusA
VTLLEREAETAKLRPVVELEPVIQFTVRGRPVPKGSLRPIQPKRKGPDGQMIPVGRPVVVPDNPRELKAWQSAIYTAAAVAMGDRDILRGPVGILITFVFPRPKSHFGVKGNVLPSAPAYPAGIPDLDKCERAVGDALKGVVLKDDAQIVSKASRKIYGDTPGVRVGITHPADELLAFAWEV